MAEPMTRKWMVTVRLTIDRFGIGPMRFSMRSGGAARKAGPCLAGIAAGLLQPGRLGIARDRALGESRRRDGGGKTQSCDGSANKILHPNSLLNQPGDTSGLGAPQIGARRLMKMLHCSIGGMCPARDNVPARQAARTVMLRRGLGG